MAKFDQIHPNVKKTYKCNQCGFSSNAPSMLKNHMRVHSGEKPFVCSQCNYSCTEAGSLKVHMRIHSGDKLYSATIPTQQQVTSRGTFSLTQGKQH